MFGSLKGRVDGGPCNKYPETKDNHPRRELSHPVTPKKVV